MLYRGLQSEFSQVNCLLEENITNNNKNLSALRERERERDKGRGIGKAY